MRKFFDEATKTNEDSYGIRYAVDFEQSNNGISFTIRTARIVELLDSETFDVEFHDNNGKTYAIKSIDSRKLMVLNYHAIAN
ncbi:MAG: hypothetical protein ABUK01_00050 [Leptospirales bacterium]